MTASELKTNIQKKLDNIEDINVLKEVDIIISFISSDREDYNDLPEEVKQTIEEGLSQLENGKKITYEELKMRNARWFMK